MADFGGGLADDKSQLGLVMEYRRRGWRQFAGVSGADDGVGGFEKGVQNRRFPHAELQVVHGGADQLGRTGNRGA